MMGWWTGWPVHPLRPELVEGQQRMSGVARPDASRTVWLYDDRTRAGGLPGKVASE